MAFEKIPIGKFSLMTHLTQKALRLYDRKGLLVPQVKDAFTGYRYYTYPQIVRGVKIRLLSDMGFGLDDIATLLDAEERGDKKVIGELMTKMFTEIQTELRKLQNMEKVLLNQTKTLELFSMSVSEPEIKEVPEIRALSRREYGNYEETIPQLVEGMFAFVEETNSRKNCITITGPVMFICHDEEYKEENADIEVALPVSGRLDPDGTSITVRTLPAVKVVSAIYKGPYQGVDVAFTKLFEYMAESNLEIAGPSRELYLNDPHEVSEGELLSEVQIPVK
jgi:effector-binding domain-containing protein